MPGLFHVDFTEYPSVPIRGAFTGRPRRPLDYVDDALRLRRLVKDVWMAER